MDAQMSVEEKNIEINEWNASVFPFRVETRVLPVFKNFINDTNADIRALACQKLPALTQSFE